MRWLADRFGVRRLLDAEVIRPAHVPCPAPLGRDVKCIRPLLDRMCGSMGIDPGRVALRIREDETMPGAAGLYERGRRAVISVARSQLDDPARLLATLAHELAHELLIGGGLLTADVPDHEWVTDLLPVCLGTGIFLANATVQDSSGSCGGWSWWQVSKQGYLPSRIFGYAFALFAFLRGEAEDTPWAADLRPDAAEPFRAGLKYLGRGGEALFHPDTAHQPRRPPTPAEAVERLRAGSPTVRLATLWDLREQAAASPEVVRAVRACLDDRDADTPGEAARTLAAFGPAAAEAVPPLLDLLGRGSAAAKAGAAEALGAVGALPERVVPELAALLADEDRGVVAAAAEALRRFGPQSEPAVPMLLASLERALVEVREEQIRGLAAALGAASPDARQCVRDYFGDYDADLRRLALLALKDLGR